MTVLRSRLQPCSNVIKVGSFSSENHVSPDTNGLQNNSGFCVLSLLVHVYVDLLMHYVWLKLAFNSRSIIYDIQWL